MYDNNNKHKETSGKLMWSIFGEHFKTPLKTLKDLNKPKNTLKFCTRKCNPWTHFTLSTQLNLYEVAKLFTPNKMMLNTYG